MFSRVLGIPVLLAAAVGVPYVATNGPSFDELWNASSEKLSASGFASNSPKSAPPGLSAQRLGEILYPHGPSSQGLAKISLHEVLRFDISKEWVYQRWSRKSTALSGLGHYGIRVALVTGTELQDVAGSLTYLFDQEGRLQRISFRGRTGDTTRLVMLAVGSHGLQRQPAAIVGEQLFQVRRNGKVYSELRTRPASVLWANSPHDSFLVNLELQRPDATTPLPLQLPPLPVVSQHPLSEQVDLAAQQEASGQAAASELEAVEKPSSQEAWKAYFPRSRVPNEQVESLEKRGRFW